MNRPDPLLLKPRKAPQQTRSAATLEAIHTATTQVLIAEGVARLTTARVAERAGVSIGTMYQYYPNKQALLFAMVEQQLETVTNFMLAAAEQLRGQDAGTVAEGLALAWLNAKTSDSEAFQTLYGIAAEFDLQASMERVLAQMSEAFSSLLAAAPDAHFSDRDAVAFMLAVLIGGSVRMVLDAAASPDNLACLRQELPCACRAYIAAAQQ
ncbi:TetR/AcrR family transcriptional regulator [Martelella lutilitoris]|uniref:TetR/AcrR family transcriptional regulator n=1 Tax=Martelella lutilitoris TaxID=2583532 RepID=A0A5C4JL68_9HYPH|nr:TetR/AcrR family transcriptional regulator [Martelella lutilitoris]TNB46068.1 TetR/AcrR family transcriptional regulator [Martelella lutilitoris]